MEDLKLIKRTLNELDCYEAPGHFGMTAMRMHGKEETGAQKFWLGHSVFLPGGGAEWAYEDNPLEKVYYVLEGEITVIDKDGVEHVVRKDEIITILPFEGRSVINKTKLPARMLVIVNYPE